MSDVDAFVMDNDFLMPLEDKVFETWVFQYRHSADKQARAARARGKHFATDSFREGVRKLLG